MDEFEALLASSRTALTRWIYARVASRADAEDIFQDTCLSAFKAFPALRDRSAFLPWILSIARRKCADWYRAQARDRAVLTDTLPEAAAPAPEESPVEDTLTLLPARDQMMLRLFYRDRLSQRQISRQLGIPEGTVKSRMSAARARFKAAYPYPPKGENGMKPNIQTLPTILPEYAIEWLPEPPLPVTFEELTGWFIVPRLGETRRWGIYDLPSRRLDVGYDMDVTGPASVHGLEGVAIRARVLTPGGSIPDGDPMKDAVDASTGGQEEWNFIAQEKDGYTRFLSAEHVEDGVRTLTTFLDGDEFMDNWGYGEDNRGMSIHQRPRGEITRTAPGRVEAEDGAGVDLVGRCRLTLAGQTYDTVCLMDLGMYQEGVASEQYVTREGRTILWRRFNRDDWAMERYHKAWHELLPDNERLTINGETFVHWYDCLCLN